METQGLFNRVLWIVLDGLGVGALPDAKEYGDENTHTLKSIADYFIEKEKRKLHLPTLRQVGLHLICPEVSFLGESHNQLELKSLYGRAKECSFGKDTTSGHWELAGLITSQAFKCFPNGFPEEILDRWIQENQLSGVLGNCSASGTEILEQLGEEHMRTLKPIVYTSADSVWQVATHEEAFGLKRLHEICLSARKICDELNISRVISRPFIIKKNHFYRTYNRKDYSQTPPSETYLTSLQKAGVRTLGIGKISNIFNGHGIDQNFDTRGNEDSVNMILRCLKKEVSGLLFANLIDFDSLYGHRRDCLGFGLALEAFDQGLEKILKALKTTDLLVITADHGNDPAHHGTDHTREAIPILCVAHKRPKKNQSPKHLAQNTEQIALGTRESFADIGASIYEALLGNKDHGSKQIAGQSFLSQLEI